MYKVYVPLMDHRRSEEDLKLLSDQLKNSGVDTVFLVFDRVLDSTVMLKEKINAFVKTRKKLMEFGLKVNAWLAMT